MTQSPSPTMAMPVESATTAMHASLMTPLALVEGEVLAYLDERPIVPLRRLRRELGWPADMVMMAVGALIRAGLVRGVQRDLEVVVKLRKPLCGALCEV